MPGSSISKKYNNLLPYILPGLLIALSVWLRIKGLGLWSLGDDEYFLIKSIENISRTGLPEFPCGGYYPRGLFHQYFTYLLIRAGIEPTLALRIFPVIMNIIAMPAVYLLAEKVFDKKTAMVALFLFCFSIWEIEFARFGRMYAPFQTVFIWYVFFFFKYVSEPNHGKPVFLFSLSLFAVLVYELAVLLAVANLFALIWQNRRKISEYLVASLILIFTFWFNSIKWRSLGKVANTNITEINDSVETAATGSRLYLPQVEILNSPDFLSITIFSLVLIISLILLRKNFTKLSVWEGAITGLLVVLLLLNQIGLAVLVLLITSLLIIPIRKDLFRILLKFLVIASSMWIVNAFISNNFELKMTIKELLNYIDYPPVLYLHIRKYFELVPYFSSSVSIILLLGMTATLIKKRPLTESQKLFIFIFIISLFFVSFLKVPYHNSRYTFFLYPMLLILVTISFYVLTELIFRQRFQLVGMTAMVILFLYYSEDFDLYHLLKTDSAEIHFRVPYPHDTDEHFYLRRDHRSVADFINKNMNHGDLVISTEIPPEYYLDKLDYIYKDMDDKEFDNIALSAQKRERWSGKPLISSYQRLQSIVDASENTVWLIIRSELQAIRSLKKNSFYDTYRDNLVFISLDGYLTVYKVE